MIQQKIVILAQTLQANDFTIEYDMNTSKIDISLNNYKNEYIMEKYVLIMNQLYYNKWIHLNTILLLLKETFIVDRLLYSKLLNRINSLFSFWDFMVLSYNIDDIWLEVLKDIKIWYKNFESKEKLIYFCKKYLCQ